MKKNDPTKELDHLPVEAGEFIKLIIKKMKYRKKVRLEVMCELAAHFEDELRECKTADERDKKTKHLIEEFGDPELLGVLLRRAKKRCRSLWRTVVARTFQAAGILILLFIVYMAWFLNGKPEITVDYVAELNKMVRPAVDESLNAAPYYHKAVEISKKISKEDSELLSKKYAEKTPEEKQKIAKILAENKKMLELMAEGILKPYYWEEYKSNSDNRMLAVSLRDLPDFRKIAYTIRWQAMLEAEQGQYEKAFCDLLNCYKFGQHIRSGGTLIEQLVGMAMENLSSGGIRQILNSYQIDRSLLAKLQNDMEQLIIKQNFSVNFSNEKLLIYDEIQRSFTGARCFSKGHIIPRHLLELQSICGDNEEILSLISELFEEIVKSGTKNSLLHPDKDITKKLVDNFYSFIEEIKFKTPAQMRIEGIDIDEQTKKITKENLFLALMIPGMGKINEISYKVKTESYATATVIAVLRYKADKGGYPENLQELVEGGYLKQVPMDAFSDKPLIYKKTDKDFVLYSVGENFIDDGGKMGTDKDKSKVWQKDGNAVFWPVGK